MAKKKFVVQIVNSQNSGYSKVTYQDILDGDCDTKEEAELLIDDLINRIPSYDYRIDERYVR